jgi:hypothetical protein
MGKCQPAPKRLKSIPPVCTHVMSDAKTYTAMNVRAFLGSKVGTARKDWVVSMMKKFPESCHVYKTQMTPYRWEPQHSRQQQAIEDAQEENGIGIPVSTEKFREKLEDLSFDCRANLDELTDDGRQIVTCNGGLAKYEIRIETDTVKWVGSAE